ncbi:hypothetical protein BpHYR1_052646 [Brachionus plicatilis]|uniref:Uncharacterized protein n=1 Tax=Brachionus plicatilis TaxID=10195 RepID=A0A3M7SA29_BRAPC|nr:hypothetical protein BpHYR1_052646 [Brachionus plicatilis]
MKYLTLKAKLTFYFFNCQLFNLINREKERRNHSSNRLLLLNYSKRDLLRHKSYFTKASNPVDQVVMFNSCLGSIVSSSLSGEMTQLNVSLMPLGV